MKIVTRIIAVMALTIMVAMADRIIDLDQDFNSLVVGNYMPPASGGSDTSADIGANIWRDDTNVIYSIVDNGSTPADPFGGAGNRSLRLSGGAGNIPGAFYDANSNVTGAGKFTLKWNRASGYSYVRLRQVNPNSIYAIVLRVNSDGIFAEDIGGGVTFDQTIIAGVNYTLIINFNTHTDKWSGTLNGTTITSGGGTVSKWDFDNAVDSIGGTYIFTYDSIASESFFDNLKLEHEQYLLDEDFQSLVVGNYMPPASGGTDTYGDVGGYSWRNAASTTYSIVDSGSTPADPFGGAGNHSLRLIGGSGNPYVMYKGNIDLSGIGHFMMKWNRSSGYSYLRIRQTAISEVHAIALRVNPDGALAEDISGGVIFDQTITAGSNYLLDIIFNTDTDNWSGTLNGTTITSGGGSVFKWDFWNPVDSIGGVYIAIYSTTTAESFFDDLKILPPYGSLIILQ